MIPSNVDTSILKTWDIILHHTPFCWYRPSTWITLGIRKFTKSYWNHSSEILIIDDVIYNIESLRGWITLSKWSDLVKQNVKIKVLRHKESIWNKDKYIIKWLKQLDKKYDYTGILKILIMLCFGWWNNPAKSISEKTRWCSEFNAWMKDLDWRQYWVPWDFDNNELFHQVETSPVSKVLFDNQNI